MIKATSPPCPAPPSPRKSERPSVNPGFNFCRLDFRNLFRIYYFTFNEMFSSSTPPCGYWNNASIIDISKASKSSTTI